MVDRLRVPFLVAAIILMGLVVLVEIGSVLLTSGNPGLDTGQPPGFGILSMALLDGTLFLTVALIGLSLVIGRNLEGRLQGPTTLIFSIIVIIAGIILVFATLQLLLLMLALLLAVPFGTIAYLALFGSFDRGGAAVLLSLLMLLKIAFAVCMVLAQQRFLQAKGLVVLVILSLVVNIVVSFLQALPPGVLVSITDAIAAIVVGIVGIIVAIVLLVFAVIATLKSLALNRDLA
ncbi:MAG: hypothetical protein ABI838_03085 [Chloroflexota bacterium]